MNFRLKRLEKVINKRLKNASIYKKKLKLLDIYHPDERKDCRDTYHLFVIQSKKRDELKEFLFKNKIESNIHYPIPIHKQKIFKEYPQTLTKTEKQSKKILSLPINQYLNEEEIEKICECVKIFFGK